MCSHIWQREKRGRKIEVDENNMDTQSEMMRVKHIHYLLVWVSKQTDSQVVTSPMCVTTCTQTSLPRILWHDQREKGSSNSTIVLITKQRVPSIDNYERKKKRERERPALPRKLCPCYVCLSHKHNLHIWTT